MQIKRVVCCLLVFISLRVSALCDSPQGLGLLVYHLVQCHKIGRIGWELGIPSPKDVILHPDDLINKFQSSDYESAKRIIESQTGYTCMYGDDYFIIIPKNRPFSLENVTTPPVSSPISLDQALSKITFVSLKNVNIGGPIVNQPAPDDPIEQGGNSPYQPRPIPYTFIIHTLNMYGPNVSLHKQTDSLYKIFNEIAKQSGSSLWEIGTDILPSRGNYPGITYLAVSFSFGTPYYSFRSNR